jgi:hypothetical protein
MTRILAALACLSLAAIPAAAQDATPLSLEQRMLLRCSAVFAIVAGEQSRGVASAAAYPPLAQRGREYFVRASARLMDELELSREQLTAHLQAEVGALQAGATEAGDRAKFIDGVMRPCLTALDASGL